MSSAITILVVEPDIKILELIEATLRLKSYRVVKLANPIAAFNYLEREVPDLIISDVDLPGQHGFDFFHGVRTRTKARKTPFVMLGAAKDPAEVARGLHMGMAEYLRKPFSVDELMIRVQRILDQSKRELAARTPSHLSGRLEALPIEDVIGLLEFLRWSGRLNVGFSADDFEGLLFLWQGSVAHAVYGFLQGNAAMIQLLLREEGAFHFFYDEEQSIPVVSIRGPVMPILEEGMRMIEEGLIHPVDVNSPEACRRFEYSLTGTPLDPELADQLEANLGVKPTSEVSFTIGASRRGRRVSKIDDGGFGEEEPSGAGMAWESYDDVRDMARTSVIIPAESAEDLESFSEEFVFEVGGDEDVDEDELEAARGWFNGIQVELMDEHPEMGVTEMLVGTHGGTALLSSIKDHERENSLASFAAQAIQFGGEVPRGAWVEHSAGALHLVIVKLSARWLLVCVTAEAPQGDRLMRILAPWLQGE